MIYLSSKIEDEMIVRIDQSRNDKREDWLFKPFEYCQFECNVIPIKYGEYTIQVLCFEKYSDDNNLVFEFKKVITIRSEKELQSKVNNAFISLENFIYHYNKQKEDGLGEHDPFVYQIIEHVAVLHKDNNGFRKEVNVISFNGKPPVVDIRTWTPNNRMTRKGITLNRDAFFNLVDVLTNQTIEMGE